MSQSNKKVIIIVDNSIAITGALKAIVNSSAYNRSFFEFVFVLPKNSTAANFIKEYGFQIYHLPFVEIGKNIKNLLLYLPYLILNGFRLKSIVKWHNADILHMNDFYNLTGIVAKIFGAKVKLLTHVRFLPQKFMPILAKFWATINLRFSDYIICVSKAVESFFPESIPRVLVIADTIPEREKHPPKIISSSENDNEINFLYLSNYIRGKGQDLALAAFKKAYSHDNRLRLTFAGGDMGLEKNRIFKLELEQDVKSSKLAGLVSFEEFVEDVELKIKAADILLNFSESESFSLTCLDALYYGTPLIASDCGGPAELFEHNVSGYLVSNKNVPEMTRAMLSLASNPQKQHSFSEAGKLYVRNKFSPERTFIKLRELYFTS